MQYCVALRNDCLAARYISMVYHSPSKLMMYEANQLLFKCTLAVNYFFNLVVLACFMINSSIFFRIILLAFTQKNEVFRCRDERVFVTFVPTPRGPQWFHSGLARECNLQSRDCTMKHLPTVGELLKAHFDVICQEGLLC
jgi:hypothetical protein